MGILNKNLNGNEETSASAAKYKEIGKCYVGVPRLHFLTLDKMGTIIQYNHKQRREVNSNTSVGVGIRFWESGKSSWLLSTFTSRRNSGEVN